MPTDPQNDVPCRDCKRPTQHATEVCDDCRTPAGRLVTALAALGIKATTSRGNIRVAGHTFVCEPGDACEPWTISDVAETLDETTEAAANAIAAIVQAPALRSERDALAAEVDRLRVELEKPVAGPWIFDGFDWLRRKADSGTFAAEVNAIGWHAWHGRDGGPSAGPETEDAGRHAADLALVAAGYRLVGGVHPLPDEVSDGA